MAYRWNLSDFASGYDAAAQIIHPHYLAIQDAILELLPNSLRVARAPAQNAGRCEANHGEPPSNSNLVVDLGGGSGRLVERILDAFPHCQAVVVDQSEPFLALSERRLARFGNRVSLVQDRLQSESWAKQLSGPVTAIVSMSAIHHLDPAEKQTLYQRCNNLLTPGGVLLNGDEIRAQPDDAYLATLTHWADHMRKHMADGSIPTTFHANIHAWIDRNVTRFGQPKKSGDDCHETIATQLAYFSNSGFSTADSPWQREVWAILRGIK